MPRTLLNIRRKRSGDPQYTDLLSRSLPDGYMEQRVTEEELAALPPEQQAMRKRLIDEGVKREGFYLSPLPGRKLVTTPERQTEERLAETAEKAAWVEATKKRYGGFMPGTPEWYAHNEATTRALGKDQQIAAILHELAELGKPQGYNLPEDRTTLPVGGGKMGQEFSRESGMYRTEEAGPGYLGGFFNVGSEAGPEKIQTAEGQVKAKRLLDMMLDIEGKPRKEVPEKMTPAQLLIKSRIAQEEAKIKGLKSDRAKLDDMTDFDGTKRREIDTEIEKLEGNVKQYESEFYSEAAKKEAPASEWKPKPIKFRGEGEPALSAEEAKKIAATGMTPEQIADRLSKATNPEDEAKRLRQINPKVAAMVDQYMNSRPVYKQSRVPPAMQFKPGQGAIDTQGRKFVFDPHKGWVPEGQGTVEAPKGVEKPRTQIEQIKEGAKLSAKQVATGLGVAPLAKAAIEGRGGSFTKARTPPKVMMAGIERGIGIDLGNISEIAEGAKKLIGAGRGVAQVYTDIVNKYSKAIADRVFKALEKEEAPQLARFTGGE